MNYGHLIRKPAWCICIALPAMNLAASAARADYLSTLQSFGGLVSHWGLEELTGASVIDSIASDSVDGNNPGTISGVGVTMDAPGPRPSDGFLGFSPSNNAIDFSGNVTQRLLMDPTGYTGVSGLTDSTLTMWFRITSTNDQHYHLGGLESSVVDSSGRYAMVMNHYDGSSGVRGFGRVDQAPSEITLSTPNGATPVYTDNLWHHAALTLEQVGGNRELKLYVDGALKALDSESASPGDTLALRDSLSFGYDVGTNSNSSGGARAMVGQLDEIAFHDHALSSSDISALYQSALNSSLPPDPALPSLGITAHRGAQQTHPENTMAAFEEAVAIGAHQIELDVRLTSDGELVVIHDSTVDRTTNGTGSVSSMTLAQIKALDAGSWKGAQFAGEQVPTLGEVLEAMPMNVWLNVHTKGDFALGFAVAQEVEAHGRKHQAILSGEGDEIAGARAAVPDILTNNMDRQGGNTTEYVETTIASNNDFIQLHKNYSFPTPTQIADLQAAGVQINYFGSNNPNQLSALLADGVEFVLVDELGPMMSQASLLGIDPMLPVYRGDLNADGILDMDDVNLFVEALTNRAAFDVAHPEINVDLYGDFNLNGSLELGDVGGFRSAVAASASAASLHSSVPEPSMMIWVGMAFLAAPSRRRHDSTTVRKL